MSLFQAFIHSGREFSGPATAGTSGQPLVRDAADGETKWASNVYLTDDGIGLGVESPEACWDVDLINNPNQLARFRVRESGTGDFGLLLACYDGSNGETRDDNVLCWGYNPGMENPAEHEFCFVVESRYKTAANITQLESYFRFSTPSSYPGGGGTWRPLGITPNLNTNAIEIHIACASVVFENPDKSYVGMLFNSFTNVDPTLNRTEQRVATQSKIVIGSPRVEPKGFSSALPVFFDVPESNTVFTGDPNQSPAVAGIVGSYGWWGIRTAVDRSFCVDTYNAGTPINAFRVFQDGIGYFASSVGVGTTTPGVTDPAGLDVGRCVEIRAASTAQLVGLFLRRSDDLVGLDITADCNSTGIIYFDSRWNDGTNGGFLFRTATSVTSVDALRISGAGRVGINNNNPDAVLEVGVTTGAADTLNALKMAGGGWGNPTAPNDSNSAGEKFLLWDEGTVRTAIGFAASNALWMQSTNDDSDAPAVQIWTGDQITAPTLKWQVANGGTISCRNIEPQTDNTYYLGKNDDDSPKAWKGVILKDTTNGKYYRLEVVSGVLTATDLTD